MRTFSGVCAVEGIGIGKAFVVPEPVKRVIPEKKIAQSESHFEWQRFENALEFVKANIDSELQTLLLHANENKTQIDIFQTYRDMLSDAVFFKEVKCDFETHLISIESIIEKKANEYADVLRSAHNEMLAERATDIIDVFDLVLDALLEINQFDVRKVHEGAVIVATSLSATDAIALSKKNIAGLALSEGALASHVVILARACGIPTIVGLKNISRFVEMNDDVIVNAKDGELIVQADDERISFFQKKIVEQNEHKKLLQTFITKKACTKDGVAFSLFANIGSSYEAARANEFGADGIGLFRTEFLFMSNEEKKHMMSENAQFEEYKKVLLMMNGKPVVIRTLDAGGDKLIQSADLPMTDEKNPLMGLRAIRLSQSYPHLLKTQLRALYRASVFGNLKILLPLITNVEQVYFCKALSHKVREELKDECISFDENVPIGIMIETAAAAIASDCFAETCDFFSIGTNDLTQYTLGVDRENQAVAHLYDETNIAVLRLILMTKENANRAQLPVSVCGEMAGKKDGALILAGMGFRSFSMSPSLIPEVKEALSHFTIAELESVSSNHLNAL